MASGKRLHYSEECTSDSSTQSDCEYNSPKVLKTNNGSSVRRPTRQPKSFSRNALMARENRLRKKIYMENVEKELQSAKGLIKKNNVMLKEQTMVIEKQEKELKYLRSVLANSSDISMLLKNIQNNTGMCVTTSLNKSFQERSTNNSTTLNDPWFQTTPTYDNELSPLLLDDDFTMPSPLNNPLPEDYLFQDSHNDTLLDHNYTLTSDDNEDVGVCLHISKHKVALEFCAGCNENANEAWLQKEMAI